jgi:hypothetical protein
LFTAIGTILEIRIQRFAAITTALIISPGLMIEIGSKFIRGCLAAIAHDKRLALFDPEYRNEEKAEVVVYAPVICLVQSAHRTPAGILIQGFRFG